MGSTEEAILSAQMASKCFSVNKFMTSSAPQMQKQSDGSGNNAGASGSSKRLEQKEMKNSAAKIVVGKQQQQRQWQQLKPRFAPELYGLHCFETLVPL